jgi:hypothetical protein
MELSLKETVKVCHLPPAGPLEMLLVVVSTMRLGPFSSPAMENTLELHPAPPGRGTNCMQQWASRMLVLKFALTLVAAVHFASTSRRPPLRGNRFCPTYLKLKRPHRISVSFHTTENLLSCRIPNPMYSTSIFRRLRPESSTWSRAKLAYMKAYVRRQIRLDHIESYALLPVILIGELS